jgi:hypothetical protein
MTGINFEIIQRAYLEGRKKKIEREKRILVKL